MELRTPCIIECKYSLQVIEFCEFHKDDPEEEKKEEEEQKEKRTDDLSEWDLKFVNVRLN